MDRRAATVRRGLGAALVLGCVSIGVPSLLVSMGGVPVPRGLPSWSQVVAALTQNGIPDAVLLQALAVICWLVWLDLAVAVCAEVIAVMRGRPVRLPGFASALQPVAAQLIAATLLAIASLTIRPAATPAPGLRAAMAVATVSGEPHQAAAPPHRGSHVSAVSGGVDYVVRRGDTLWSIAQRKLGDALRWPRIFDLNRGRMQPDRRALLNPHWIYPGWVLDLPDDSAQRPGATGTSPNGSNGSSPPSAAAWRRARASHRARRRYRHRPLHPPALERRCRDRRRLRRGRIKLLRRLPPGWFSRRVMWLASGWRRHRGCGRHRSPTGAPPAGLCPLRASGVPSPADPYGSSPLRRALEGGRASRRRGGCSAPPAARANRRDEPGVISIGDAGWPGARRRDRPIERQRVRRPRRRGGHPPSHRRASSSTQPRIALR